VPTVPDAAEDEVLIAEVPATAPVTVEAEPPLPPLPAPSSEQPA
jgi:hypothetical protein